MLYLIPTIELSTHHPMYNLLNEIATCQSVSTTSQSVLATCSHTSNTRQSAPPSVTSYKKRPSTLIWGEEKHTEVFMKCCCLGDQRSGEGHHHLHGGFGGKGESLPLFTALPPTLYFSCFPIYLTFLISLSIKASPLCPFCY